MNRESTRVQRGQRITPNGTRGYTNQKETYPDLSRDYFRSLDHNCQILELKKSIASYTDIRDFQTWGNLRYRFMGYYFVDAFTKFARKSLSMLSTCRDFIDKNSLHYRNLKITCLKDADTRWLLLPGRKAISC